jgi:hypothetical protein
MESNVKIPTAWKRDNITMTISQYHEVNIQNTIVQSPLTTKEIERMQCSMGTDYEIDFIYAYSPKIKS